MATLRLPPLVLVAALASIGCDSEQASSAAPATVAPAEASTPVAAPTPAAEATVTEESAEVVVSGKAAGSAPAAAMVTSAAKPRPATLRGSCEHFVECRCQPITVSECVETLTEQTGGQTLPTSLYTCINDLGCDDLCGESSPAMTRCFEAAADQIEADTQVAARAQASHHRTMMGIIGNMGATCPAGQRMVHGSCVDY